MRLAYLITAYDQPEHLHRTVRALQGEGCDFYIHVDGAVDIAPFMQGLQGRPDVQFANHRIRVQWMGFSQVESILGLLRQACARGFDYCVLLSGSDYPIKPNAFLHAFYARADQEFITFWRLSDRPSWAHKIEYFYPIDLVPIRGWSKDAEPVYWRRLFWGRLHQYRRFMPRRKFPLAMTPYGGSDWWSLSQGCVRHILDFVERNPAYSRFYRYSHCPSEMFFQTIVLNSQWGPRVRNFAEYEAWSASTTVEDKRAERSMLPESAFNLRYIDWSGETDGSREAPAFLDDGDWQDIVDSDCLFARKFDTRRSAALLTRIDREVLGLC